MLPSLSGNKKKKNYCQVLFLEMCRIIKTGRIHFFKFVLLTRPYFVGILHPNSSEQKELWYPWQAQLICSKLEILSWRLVSCLHIRHGSQILMCHLPPWLEAASLACNHPVSRKPSPQPARPQHPCPSQRPDTYPNKASPRLFAW